MKATVAFIFFMLFLAGIAFVNLKGMKSSDDLKVLAPEQLADIAWRATAIGEMRLDEDSGIHVQFDADGQVTGNSGCNRFFGSYELQEGKLSIGPLGATRMACPEPAMSFEISFLAALQSADTAARADDRLAIRNADGVTVARFVAIN